MKYLKVFELEQVIEGLRPWRQPATVEAISPHQSLLVSGARDRTGPAARDVLTVAAPSARGSAATGDVSAAGARDRRVTVRGALVGQPVGWSRSAPASSWCPKPPSFCQARWRWPPVRTGTAREV